MGDTALILVFPLPTLSNVHYSRSSRSLVPALGPRPGDLLCPFLHLCEFLQINLLTNKVLQLEKKKLQQARQQKSAKARNTRQPPKKNRVVEKEGDDESHEEGDDERGRKEDEDEE